MRALLLIPALALAACGGSDADPAAPPTVAAADIDPCEALTPAMVAQALGIAETDVAYDQEQIDTMEQYGMESDGVCLYALADGGDYDAVNLTIEDYQSASAAENQFDAAYQTKTEAQLAEIDAAGDRAADELVADGRGEALEGIDAGAMLSGLVGKFSYEPVDGVGDQAVVEINGVLDPPVAGPAIVRDGAIVYKLMASPQYGFMTDPANSDAIRDAQIALARQVVR